MHSRSRSTGILLLVHSVDPLRRTSSHENFTRHGTLMLVGRVLPAGVATSSVRGGVTTTALADGNLYLYSAVPFRACPLQQPPPIKQNRGSPRAPRWAKSRCLQEWGNRTTVDGRHERVASMSLQDGRMQCACGNRCCMLKKALLTSIVSSP